jgi:hypothetical protein
MRRRSCLPPGWLGDEAFPVDPECSCGLSVAPFEFHRPGCDRTGHPYIDGETLTLVEAAVESLVCLRGSGLGDAGAALSALASLIAEAQTRLPDAVADARDHDDTWAEIATRLAVTASTAQRRYGHYARWRAGRLGRGD